MKYIVYQTINLKNNKIYIGQHATTDPYKFDGYLGCGIMVNTPSSYMRARSPLQLAVKKYGVKNFRRTTIKICDTREEALSIERSIVDEDFIKRKDTYNIQIGGNNILRYYPVHQFDINGTYIKEWINMNEAAVFYGVSHTAIMNAVKYKGSCAKFYWSKNKKIDVSEFYCKETTCYEYDSDTLKVKNIYNSAKEAAIELGVCPQSITNAMMSGYKIRGSYFSSKLMDEFIVKPKVSLRNKSLFVYSLEGEYIVTLNNTKEILEFFSIKNSTCITTAIRKGVPYKDYQLSLEYKDRMETYLRNNFYKREVLVYDLYGNFIEEIPTIAQACSKYSRGVQKVLRGTQRQCMGFVFKYK